MVSRVLSDVQPHRPLGGSSRMQMGANTSSEDYFSFHLLSLPWAVYSHCIFLLVLDQPYRGSRPHRKKIKSPGIKAKDCVSNWSPYCYCHASVSTSPSWFYLSLNFSTLTGFRDLKLSSSLYFLYLSSFPLDWLWPWAFPLLSFVRNHLTVSDSSDLTTFSHQVSAPEFPL